MHMVVLFLRTRPVGIVEAQQPFTIYIMECERVFDPARTGLGRFNSSHSKSDAPSILQPVAPAIVIKQSLQCLVHG